MFASRLLHPEAVGSFTEAGNLVGEFTVDGTIDLILFGGLGSGLIAGVVWVFTRQWIADSYWLVGLGAMLIGGFALVEADNPDFVILVDPVVDLVLLLGLVFSFGVVLVWFDRRLDRWLPSGGGIGWKIGYAVVALVGLPFLIPAFGTFFSQAFCTCQSPPVWTGVFLVGAAATTVTWWVLDLRRVVSSPPILIRIGRIAVLGAGIAGGVHLTAQVTAIL